MTPNATIPNLITLGRLFAVPVEIWLVLVGRFQPAVWLFLAAGASDAIDGFIAKRFNQRSELGRLLDPVADKALLMSVYVTLGMARSLPVSLVILVVARDVMILGGFLLLGALGEPPSVQPLRISKINTMLQIVLAGLALARRGYGIEAGWLLWVLAWAVAASTLASGAAYVVVWARGGSQEARP